MTGTEHDTQSPVYAAVKSRLMRYRATDKAIRFVYIFRVMPVTREVFFLADSEPPGSAEISLPGDAYPEAAGSPGLQSIIDGGVLATEGPIEDALDMVALRASEKQIEIVYSADENVPKFVMADPGRLRQVLLNLIGNAVKFTEQGEINVTLTARALPADQAAKKWELQFAVNDTGIGIDEAKFPKLFRPFSQLEETIARRYSGAGLGLAISRNLVELMGGSIGLTSKVGVGSTFTFGIVVE